MKKLILPAVIFVVGTVILLPNAIFKLENGYSAVLSTNGKPIKSISESGSHFKIPFIQDVSYIYTGIFLKNVGMTSELNTGLTVDIKSRIQWKINNPVQFAKSKSTQDNASDLTTGLIVEFTLKNLNEQTKEVITSCPGISYENFCELNIKSLKTNEVIVNALKSIGVSLLNVETKVKLSKSNVITTN